MAELLLTDSGLETWLIFHRGVDLADFASFPLLEDEHGRQLLGDYYRAHLEVAARAGVGVVLETPTWRANPDWGERLGYDATALDRANRESVDFVRALADEGSAGRVVVSGNLGPRGDAYAPDALMGRDEAADYHRAQIRSFVAAGADQVTLLTATHVGEAAGVVAAAEEEGVPVVAAFTVETDGRLPSGQPLDAAIEEVDDLTGAAALHFGLNCAHPDHFGESLRAGSEAVARLRLLRANASRASHAELDEAEELDEGDPDELGAQYAELLTDLPHLTVLGGCCGTDVRHVEAIARACGGLP